MADEFRTLTVNEVDPVTRTVKGRDEFNQPLAVTNQFVQPLTTVPSVGEKWLVHRQGGQWLLDRRWDGDDKFMGLEAGDVHIDAKNNLVIEAQKVLINGNEINNNLLVKFDQDAHSTNAIKFISSESITFNLVPDIENETVDVRATAQIPSAYIPPVGIVNSFAGTTAPDGWLLCDGSAVSRTDYADLFAIVSTTYGVGDGSTTFNLPDMQGRVAVGKGTHTDVSTLGNNDGQTAANRRPKHKHTVNDPTHSHTAPIAAAGAGGALRGAATTNTPSATSSANNAAATGVTVGPQTTVPTDAPAYIVLNYIIKT